MYNGWFETGVYTNEVEITTSSGKPEGGKSGVPGKTLAEAGVLGLLGMVGLYYLLKKKGG